MKKLLSLAIFAMAMALALLVNAPAKAQTRNGAPANVESSLAAKRAEHLRHGINLSDWLMASGNPPVVTEQHFSAAITSRDLALIRAMGFDHVRLCIDPAPMLQRGHADEIPAAYLGYLDTR